MPTRRIKLATLLLLTMLLLAAGISWSRAADARLPTADFVAPLSSSAARAAVQAAQTSEAQFRARLAQPTGVGNADQLPTMQTVYFPQTGHHLSNRSGFLNFWRANGQVGTFGYPITEELVERGRIVQYFERARLEFHPELATDQQVQLGLIGREMLAIQGTPDGLDDPQNGARYFPETRHTLGGTFARAWDKRGGLRVFGFPLSETVDEQGRSVQYFERAKLVYLPEQTNAFLTGQAAMRGFPIDTLGEVQLSDLGRQLAQLRSINIAPLPQLLGTLTWDPALWERRIEVNLSEQWLSAYEGNLLVYRAPVATGRDGFNTPVGEYAIYSKYDEQTMAGCLGDECWTVPNIPWVQYVVGGVALHGTYWHNAHGTGVRMSHGCINLRVDDAEWLYKWAAVGTRVIISY